MPLHEAPEVVPFWRRVLNRLIEGRGHALLALGVRLAAAGLAYVLQVLLARALGAADYGNFNIAWNILTIGGFMATLGFSEISVRFLAQYQQHQQFSLFNGFLRVGVMVTMGGAMVAALMGLLLLPAIRIAYGPLTADLLQLGLLALPFFALTDYYEGVARSQGWTVRALLPPYVLRQGGIIAIVAVLLAFSGAVSPQSVMMVCVIASILAALAHTALLSTPLRQTMPSVTPSYDLANWRRAAAPTLLSEIAMLARLNVDLIVLGLFVSPALVGQYFAATRLASLLGLLEFAVKAGMGHRFARAALAPNPSAAVDEVYREARRLSFWPGLAAALILALASPLVLGIFGPEFVQAAPFAIVLIAATGQRLLLGPADEALAMTGHPHLVWRANGLGALVMGAGTALLAPQIGAMGAAIATFVGTALSNGLMLHFLRRHLGISPLSRAQERP